MVISARGVFGLELSDEFLVVRDRNESDRWRSAAVIAGQERHRSRAMFVEPLLHTGPRLEHLQHGGRGDLHLLRELADLLVGLVEMSDHHHRKGILGDRLKNAQIGAPAESAARAIPPSHVATDKNNAAPITLRTVFMVKLLCERGVLANVSEELACEASVPLATVYPGALILPVGYAAAQH